MYRCLPSCPFSARDHTHEAVGKEKYDKQSDDGNDQGCHLAGRTERLGHADQEDGTDGRAKDRPPPAKHGGDNDLHADGNVDERTDGSRAEIENEKSAAHTREEGADDKGCKLMLRHIES